MTIPPPWWFWFICLLFIEGLILIEAEREPVKPVYHWKDLNAMENK